MTRRPSTQRPRCRRAPPSGSRARGAGFTLVELLVALAAMAVLALMSWRGIDGMVRAQQTMRANADAVLTLQAGLAQWGTDLDAIAALPGTQALDWDGRALRITRRGSAGPGDGVRVVAWTRRAATPAGAPAGTWWLRWQSPPVATLTQWRDAWQQAAVWAQNPGQAERAGEVAVLPLAEWQVFFFRNDAWSNALSAEGTPTSVTLMPGLPAGAALAAAPPSSTEGALPSVPEGIRVVLQPAPGGPVAGTLTRDWVNPTLAQRRT